MCKVQKRLLPGKSICLVGRAAKEEGSIGADKELEQNSHKPLSG
jgi:hypothetical protein